MKKSDYSKSATVTIKPEFANDISECTDTSRLYVLPDNFIYAYMKKEVLNTPNFFDLSNGSEINKRISSSNSEVSHDGLVLTGFIDVVPQSPYIMTIKGVTLTKVYDIVVFACAYDADKNVLGKKTIREVTIEKVDGIFPLLL